MLNSILLQITSPAGDSAANAASTIASSMPVMAQPTETSLSLVELLLKGGYVMYPIGILLLMTIYFFVERLLTVSRTGKADSNFMNNIKDMLSSGNIDAAKTLCKHTPGPQAAMVEKGMRHLGKPVKEIEDAMSGVAQAELYRLEKNMSILSIVGRVSPMMGFIGTIIGVINIFYKISLSKTVEIDVISEGLYQKMISSASGLGIGIFAFICYYVIQIMVDKRVHAMERTSMEFMDILSEPNK